MMPNDSTAWEQPLAPVTAKTIIFPDDDFMLTYWPTPEFPDISTVFVAHQYSDVMKGATVDGANHTEAVLVGFVKWDGCRQARMVSPHYLLHWDDEQSMSRWLLRLSHTIEQIKPGKP